MPEQPPAIAPVYRYFTADLLTNTVLAEIPFRGVSWERALKGAGKFDGKIPVTAETDSMDLYNTTMPGQTALFVVRNGVAVWGGIIWSRQYEFGSRDLSVSASEFSSYFYHRRIWKTWNHQLGATVKWMGKGELTQVEDRRNYANNPSAVSTGTLTDWTARYWTRSFVTTGGPAGTPTFARLTNPASASAQSAGFDVFGNGQLASPGTDTAWLSMFVEEGEAVSVSAMVRTSFSYPINIAARMHNGSGAWVGSQFYLGVDTTPPANTWTQVSGSFTAPATGYVVFMIAMNAPSATYAASATFDATQLLIEKSETIDTFFTGATTDTATEDYQWVGTVNASPSIKMTTIGVPAFRVIYDQGTNSKVRPGSTVNLEFYDMGNYRYNGKYRVADTPGPTTDGFTILGGGATADIVAYGLYAGTEADPRGGYVITTKEPHGFATGDSVTVRLTSNDGQVIATPVDVSYPIIVEGGSESRVFKVAIGPGYANKATAQASGIAYRPLPKGTYTSTTVSVRQDTYDYVRSLIDSMFDDFVGADFPNIYLEPGISEALSIVKKEANNGYNIIQTSEPHNVSPGQAVQVKNVDSIFDGEFEVTDTPTATTLVYKKGGQLAPTVIGDKTATINIINATNGLVTITTIGAHGFSKGQNVSIDIGGPYTALDGTYPIEAIPTTSKFTYRVPGNVNIASITLPASSATVGGVTNTITRASVENNVVTMELRDPVSFTAGNSVTIAGVEKVLTLKEKALDAQNNVASIQTTEPHGLLPGAVVVVQGLVDSANVSALSTTATSTTLTTARPHNFRKGDSVSVDGTDEYRITKKQLINNTAQLTFDTTHIISAGDTISVESLYDELAVAGRKIVNKVATVTTKATHNLKVNDEVAIVDMQDYYTPVSKEAQDGVIILTMAQPHNIFEGQKIIVSNMGAPFDGTEITVSGVTATRISYSIDNNYWDPRKETGATVPMTVPQTRATANSLVVVPESYFNGSYVVSARTPRSFSFAVSGNDQPYSTRIGSPSVLTPSIMNGTYTVTGTPSGTSVTYTVTGADVAAAVVPPPADEETPVSKVTMSPKLLGSHTVTAVTSNTVTFADVMPRVSSRPAPTLFIRKGSIFNGTKTITGVPTADRFQFTLSGYKASYLEESTTNAAYAVAPNLYNGTYSISSVDASANTITFTATGLDTVGSHTVVSRGRAKVSPTLIVSTFGPYPGNGDIGIGYGGSGYTRATINPISYRGFELKNIGEALEAYSDSINGFEYRIDCEFDEVNETFRKKFIMIPIDFPNPPGAGEISPIERFGADRLVFEYPGGSITDVSMEESAEESATRFFAVGTTDLGPDAGPNIGVAAANDLLQGRKGRRWPLLDAETTVDGVDDKNVLHAHATRYLGEAAPPYMTMQVSVNGSIPPFVDSYKPGDWCSLVLRDPFYEMRLKSGLEPRDNIMVRKINSFRVQVPDGVTFPETVSLDLVAEWEVDKRGE